MKFIILALMSFFSLSTIASESVDLSGSLDLNGHKKIQLNYLMSGSVASGTVIITGEKSRKEFIISEVNPSTIIFAADQNSDESVYIFKDYQFKETLREAVHYELVGGKFHLNKKEFNCSLDKHNALIVQYLPEQSDERHFLLNCATLK